MSDDPHLTDLLQLSEADRESLLRKAVEAHSGGELKLAETLLIGLISVTGDDVRPVKLLASCLMQQDRLEDAERAYERSYALDATDAYVMADLGEVKLKLDKLDEALPIFEKLFATDPSSKHPAVSRGRRLVREYYKATSAD